MLFLAEAFTRPARLYGLAKLTLTAAVRLAGLQPDDVVVHAVLGRVDSENSLRDPQTVAMTHVGSGEGGTENYTTTTALPVAGWVGYTVRVLPHHHLLASDSEFALVSEAS